MEEESEDTNFVSIVLLLIIIFLLTLLFRNQINNLLSWL